MSDTFPVILLLGRPAAGKSEVIDYLKQMPADARSTKMHVAPFEEIDDFVWVWQLFEDDNVRATLGRERLNTTADYNFKDEFLWNWLIGKINLEFRKKLARDPQYLGAHTAIIEFARGGENGFGEAFTYLADEILERAVIVYIAVSYQESLRKNRRRARPGLEDSILYHSLPDKKLERIYLTNDWEKLSGGQPAGVLQVKGHRIPFAVFQNEPEQTDDPAKLGPALQAVFGTLWNLKK